MLDSFGLPSSPEFDKFVFEGNSQAAGESWYTWYRPKGRSRIAMFVAGGGGGGGAGAIGAVGSAAGGGGGGGAATMYVEMPLDFLPPRLYISVAQPKTGAGVASYVSTLQSTDGQHVIAIGNPGRAAGSAVGNTVGSSGQGAVLTTAATMVYGWRFIRFTLTGINGSPGAASGGATATSVTKTTNGNYFFGAPGGGGIGAAASAGGGGGGVNATASPSFLPGIAGGAGGATATTPPGVGQAAPNTPEAGLFTFWPGTGGGGTHGSATGAGLVQARGGNGGIGCGGGGSGGALTNSTAAPLSMGGPGLVVFWCY